MGARNPPHVIGSITYEPKADPEQARTVCVCGFGPVPYTEWRGHAVVANAAPRAPRPNPTRWRTEAAVTGARTGGLDKKKRNP